jgi:hypothetical protein
MSVPVEISTTYLKNQVTGTILYTKIGHNVIVFIPVLMGVQGAATLSELVISPTTAAWLPAPKNIDTNLRFPCCVVNSNEFPGVFILGSTLIFLIFTDGGFDTEGFNVAEDGPKGVRAFHFSYISQD